MCTQPTPVIRFSRQTQGRVHSANGRLARFVIMPLISLCVSEVVTSHISKQAGYPGRPVTPALEVAVWVFGRMIVIPRDRVIFEQEHASIHRRQPYR